MKNLIDGCKDKLFNYVQALEVDSWYKDFLEQYITDSAEADENEQWRRHTHREVSLSFDGDFHHSESKDFMLMPLRDELQKNGYFVRYALSQLQANSALAFSVAHLDQGYYLEIPENIVLEKPIVLPQNIKSSIHNLFIKVCRGAQVSFLEEGVDSVQDHHHSLVFDIESGAQVDYIRYNSGGNNFFNDSIHLHAQASLNLVQLNLETPYSRQNSHVYLEEEGAHCSLNGLYYLKNQERAEHYTQIHHLVGENSSHQLYKGILDHEARAIFQGMIHVCPQAQKVDSEQLNQNILLSRNAHVLSQPQLKIDADDVKCSHGCTTGELGLEEIFYLNSRGIKTEEARKMLLEGHLLESLCDISNESFKKNLSERVKKVL